MRKALTLSGMRLSMAKAYRNKDRLKQAVRAREEGIFDIPQVQKWEHEHFVNMVVYYGLKVQSEDGAENL